MGRSRAACFRIIPCGSESVDKNELEASESKSSSDRRGWSFGKRSARHHVLSSTVISETPSANKDSTESAGINSFKEKASEAQSQSKFLENSAVGCIDETKFPTTMETELLKMSATEVDDDKANVTPKESDVIVIQTAIRLFLAQKVVLKNKNVIKLQAAVRGHLVRRCAVGTLRCAQAIVKVQALFRARRCIKQDEKHDKYNHSSKTLGKENLDGKPQVTYTSIANLLNNRFAHQLLESSPRTKTINFKCDPSKSDSAWKWLERWTSVSSMESRNTEISGHKQEKKMLEQFADNLTETVTQSESYFESSDVKCGTDTSAVPSESEDNLITYDADSLDFQAHQLTSPSSSYKPEEPEGKTFSFGSRKSSNPAFIAAQSKFEELSSTVNKSKVKDIESCNNHTSSSANNSDAKTKEIISVENSDLHNSVQVVGSECGTELSITSTLDSPDGYEVNSSMDTTIHHQNSNENLGIDANDQTFKGVDLPEELTPEPNATDVQMGQESEAYKSPESSPESQTKSFNRKTAKPKTRSEKSGSNHPKRGAFGLTKSDHVDKEPRDSNSSYSIPSYMQATKSAKAKAISNSSPRSSPDAHNKDAYIKKRHPLSGSNGRMGSPRIQHSLSTAQHGANGNGTRSPNERKWQR